MRSGCKPVKSPFPTVIKALYTVKSLPLHLSILSFTIVLGVGLVEGRE